jgi:hypothetical protein
VRNAPQAQRPRSEQVITKEKIDAAEKVINAHMGLGEMKHFNREGCAPLHRTRCAHASVSDCSTRRA